MKALGNVGLVSKDLTQLTFPPKDNKNIIRLFNFFTNLRSSFYLTVWTNGPNDNFSSNVEAHLRVLKPPTLSLNLSSIRVHKDEELYIKGTTHDAYPAASILWKIEDRNLLETSPETCPENEDPSYVCPSFSSTLAYTGQDLDDNKNLEFVAKQIDSFKNVLNTTKTVQIEIVVDSDGGGEVLWTAGKISGLVFGVIFLILLLLLLLLIAMRYRRRRRLRKDIIQELVNSSNDNTEIVVIPSDLDKYKYTNNLVVKDAPDESSNNPYNQQIKPWPFIEYGNKQTGNARNRKYRYWDPYESEEDELLIFAWEGFGRPISPAASLSSLESEVSHLDDLDLTTPLHNLQIRGPFKSDHSNSLSSDTTTLQNATWSDNDKEDSMEMMERQSSSSSEMCSSSDTCFNSYSISNDPVETYV